ncbi:unnamed protein product [Cylicocyclus nassatus]|uniref:Uncharacterized protein n=1 Tax=Cylicocyclus nassatus TaxID=53992 RepID=A0AA36M9X1_CYLNA|nr:unnamed protein product [Cylicocyclus nassatus]
MCILDAGISRGTSAAEEGVESLNTLDLQQACRARGVRAIGLSEEVEKTGIAESPRQKLIDLENGKVEHEARLDLIKKDKEKVVLAEGEKERVAVEEIASTSTKIAGTSTEAIHAAKKELIDVVQEAVDAAKATGKEKAVAESPPFPAVGPIVIHSRDL